MSNDDNYTVATNEIEFCPTVRIQAVRNSLKLNNKKQKITKVRHGWTLETLDSYHQN